MRTIYLIQHAQSQHHIQKRVGGWYDTELTALGRQQAEATAQALHQKLQRTSCKIYSSDLLRAAQTADIIGKHLESSPIYTPKLREISFGQAEGKPQSWLQEHIVLYPEQGNRMQHAICEGAETRHQFASRLYTFMAELEQPHLEHTILVSHGFALTFLIAAWMQLPIEALGYINFAGSPGGITSLVEDTYFYSRTLQTLNDTQHLQALSTL